MSFLSNLLERLQLLFRQTDPPILDTKTYPPEPMTKYLPADPQDAIPIAEVEDTFIEVKTSVEGSTVEGSTAEEKDTPEVTVISEAKDTCDLVASILLSESKTNESEEILEEPFKEESSEDPIQTEPSIQESPNDADAKDPLEEVESAPLEPTANPLVAKKKKKKSKK